MFVPTRKTRENVFSAPGKTIKEKRTVAFENLVKGSFARRLCYSLCFRTAAPLVSVSVQRGNTSGGESDRCINISNEGENIK